MSQSQKTNWGQFIPLVTVFFFWGFVAASNEILIPVFKKSFDLSQAESQLVAVAYYIAYTVGALIYMGVSLLAKQDLINKFGYKNSLSFGLLLSAIGTFFFIPAANTGSFPLMLTGLFTVGLGFSLQQTVANPLAIALGDASTGSQRLTLAGGINNLGTTIGPLIVAYAIFGAGGEGETTLSIEAVKIPYLCLGVAFLAVAIFLKFSSLPNHPEQEEDSAIATSKNDKSSALKYPQLLLGMLAIFLYVGVEVSTVSNLPAYMHNELGFDIQGVTPYVSLYWASMMIGRWGGAAEAFGLDKTKTLALKFIAPYLAFGIFLLVNYIAGHDLKPFYLYSVIILIMILASLWTNGNPAKMLLTFSIIGIVTINDILDELVGDTPENQDEDYEIVEREDGTWLIDGQFSIYEFEKFFEIDIDEDIENRYVTVAGIFLDKYETIPNVGDKVEVEDLTLEIVDKDGNRIDKILAYRKK